jgi:hypothetical protein
MAAEDRDRLFERALTRHLRGQGPDIVGTCLDADTLAAYQEGALSEEERSAAKIHFGSCARCREIVAQLVATERFSGLEESEGELAVGLLPQPKGDAGKVARFPGKKKWLLRWATPMGAIAAGILLYVSFRDFRSPAKRVESVTQIAENRDDHAARESYSAPAAPQPNAKQQEDSLPAEAPQRQRAKSSIVRDEEENSRAQAEPPEHLKNEKKSVPPVASPSPTFSAGTGQAAGRISAVGAGKGLAKTENLGAASKATSADSLQARAAAENKPASRDVAGIGGTAAAPPAPPFPPSSSQVVVTEAAPMASTETVEVSPLRKSKDADSPVASQNGFSKLELLPSGGIAQSGKSIWRFGQHGAISHSGDGGKTWTSQIAPVTAVLTSGSAPAKNICWIAGGDGALLRTTDGGKRWQPIITPIAGNLGGVVATDGKHATIWDAPRMQTFRTSDGGKTWEKQPPK